MNAIAINGSLTLLGWLNLNQDLAQWMTVVILIITAYLAYRIGIKQNSINELIEKIEDSAEVFAYAAKGNNPNLTIWVLLVTNVGKVQMYMKRYTVETLTPMDVNNALIPAGQQQNAWYQIVLPPMAVNTICNISLELEDHVGRMWESSIDATFFGSGWTTNVHKIEQVI